MHAGRAFPSVLFISQDDTGFGQLGCYGRPIEMADLDTLAADNLRADCLHHNNMHTTALCSSSRLCIPTVRNHHSNGVVCITEGSEKSRKEKCEYEALKQI